MATLYKKAPEKKLRFEDLQCENENILLEIQKFEALMDNGSNKKKLAMIKTKFKALTRQCYAFNLNINTNLNESKVSADRSLRMIESSKSKYSHICQKKNRIKSQEIVINNQEREWERSLGRIKGL